MNCIMKHFFFKAADSGPKKISATSSFVPHKKPTTFCILYEVFLDKPDGMDEIWIDQRPLKPEN